METKRRGWKEGIMTKDLAGFNGNTIHTKGSLVRYRKIRSVPDADGFKHSEFEWHYLDQNNFNLVRTREFLIEDKKK